MPEVPTLVISHFSEAEKRAYIIADNKLAIDAGWDQDLLAIELQFVLDQNWDVDLTGFTVAEADLVLGDARSRSAQSGADSDNVIPPPEADAITRLGDIWRMGRHRLICGDARDIRACEAVLKGEQADLIFMDPPYNVPIKGHVSGLGAPRHREFAFASGEMSSVDFTAFLACAFAVAGVSAKDGAIAFVCMDWRHITEVMAAGDLMFNELKNLVVWNKNNAGMGSFYRSKHELIFVFKVGTAPHTNNFGLGDTGRYRTNVWDYPGISSLSGTRAAELGSGLIGHSQNMTVAARAMAERKTVGQRS